MDVGEIGAKLKMKINDLLTPNKPRSRNKQTNKHNEQASKRTQHRRIS
jgi:hypothetical protein